MTRYLITPSLLNSWDYYLKYDGRESFIKTLKKEFETNPAIEFGKEFEDDVQKYCDSKNQLTMFEKLPENDRSKTIKEIGDMVAGGVWQMRCYRDYKNFLLYGRMDVVSGNTIYDIKTTQNYDVGKFKASAQHKLYLYCTGLEKMKYVVAEVCRGVKEINYKGVSIEEYTDREIEPVVDEFIKWLEYDQEAKEIYYKNWEARR